MTRLFITLLASFMALSTMAQTTAPHQLFKTCPTPAALENFYQLYTQSLQQARTTQAHDSVSFAIWDNGVWMDLQHSKITRDAQNRIVEVVNYDPMASPTQPSSKFEMTYSRGKLYRQSLLVPVVGGWRTDMALEYRYDVNGNQTSTTFSVWDQGGSLQLFYGDSLEYSYINQEIVGISYAFGFAIGGIVAWEPVLLFQDIAYDPQGKPSSFIQAEFDSQTGQWLAPVKLSNIQWGFGFVQWSDLFWAITPLNQGLEPLIAAPVRLIEPTSYLVTAITGEPLYRTTAHLQAGLVLSVKFENYQTNTGWVPEYEQRFSYNAQNKVTAMFFAPFDAATGQFVDAQRSFYNYQQAYFTGYTIEIFQGNIWDLIGGIEYIYAFDTDNRVTEIVSRTYVVPSGIWMNNDRITYHYPAQTTSVGRLAKDELKVFPNPTQGNIDIQMLSNKNIDRIVVRNIQGQELLIANFNTQNNIEHSLDLSNMPAGVYFVQIQAGRETGVVRVIKR